MYKSCIYVYIWYSEIKAPEKKAPEKKASEKKRKKAPTVEKNSPGKN